MAPHNNLCTLVTSDHPIRIEKFLERASALSENKRPYVTKEMIMKSGGVMGERDGAIGARGTHVGSRRDVGSATFAPRHNNASQIIMDV
ncbi:unnamed protein product [Leptosia nina]|uniref:Uncharacterized protein n=1 Tax=Leptosia nina TaxID=320188 RepID=A0AAV1K3R5_9NEOP